MIIIINDIMYIIEIQYIHFICYVISFDSNHVTSYFMRFQSFHFNNESSYQTSFTMMMIRPNNIIKHNYPKYKTNIINHLQLQANLKAKLSSADQIQLHHMIKCKAKGKLSSPSSIVF